MDELALRGRRRLVTEDLRRSALEGPPEARRTLECFRTWFDEKNLTLRGAYLSEVFPSSGSRRSPLRIFCSRASRICDALRHRATFLPQAARPRLISVLERRSGIGSRRALGATRGHVRAQFLCESLLPAAAGGVAGTIAGSLVTGDYARSRGWEAVVPPEGRPAASARRSSSGRSRGSTRRAHFWTFG